MCRPASNLRASVQSASLAACSHARKLLADFSLPNIPNTFPRIDLMDLYLRPLTSFTAPSNIPDHMAWVHQEISIPGVVQFCTQHLGWDTFTELQNHFETKLWGAVFLRMIYSRFAFYDPRTRKLTAPSANAEILLVESKARRGQFLVKYGDKRQVQFQISTSNFDDILGSLVIPLPGTASSTSRGKPSKVTVWLPFGFIPRTGLFPDGFIPETHAELPPPVAISLDPAHQMATIRDMVQATRAADYTLESAIVERSSAEPQSRRGLLESFDETLAQLSDIPFEDLLELYRTL
ncbi:hypothetical protein D9613_004606 [Agrocybe pediades]|uniref:Uncharacterized protein n=1 Tax=Agrocybe pediades TaxID=84607 RepID=A0A8H4VII3_9AGAR|nr:hypothetical protein D9613_004606 [Agrocybe pediades]